MDRARAQSRYAPHYENVRTSILANATAHWEVLDCAIIEVVSGMLTRFDSPTLGNPQVASGYEAMRHLDETKSFAHLDAGLQISRMHMHDIVLAYALFENEVANFLLGRLHCQFGWDPEEADKVGTCAADSAVRCLAWAQDLRQNARSDEHGPSGFPGHEDGMPKHWAFRPASRLPVGSWRRPRTVWVAPEFWDRRVPQLRAAFSPQLEALKRALSMAEAMRGSEASPASAKELRHREH